MSNTSRRPVNHRQQWYELSRNDYVDEVAPHKSINIGLVADGSLAIVFTVSPHPVHAVKIAAQDVAAVAGELIYKVGA